MTHHLQVFCILTLNHQVNRKIKNNKGTKIKPVVLLLEYYSILRFSHWEEHVVDGLSNNFEFGLEVCFLHHTIWVCKLNNHARPCQRLLRCLKKVPLTTTEGLLSKDLYISCVMEKSCEVQESPSEKPNWYSVKN